MKRNETDGGTAVGHRRVGDSVRVFARWCLKREVDGCFSDASSLCAGVWGEHSANMQTAATVVQFLTACGRWDYGYTGKMKEWLVQVQKSHWSREERLSMHVRKTLH